MKKFLPFVVIAAAMAFIGPALAIDFDRKITNLDGTPLRDDKGNEATLTVRAICLTALEAPLKPEEQSKPDSGKEKTLRNELALHVLRAPHKDDAPKSDPKTPIDAKQAPDNYNFTAEDIVLIKKLVNDNYPSPLVVSQTWKALEEK